MTFEIVAADGELLSEGFDRLLEVHPVWPRVAVMLVALHLMNFLHPVIDPLHWLTFLRRGRRVGECDYAT